MIPQSFEIRPVLDETAVGDDVVVTRWIGLEGTGIIVSRKEEMLKKTFSSAFIKKADNLSKDLSVEAAAGTAVSAGASGVYDIAGCGIFGALWDMAEKAKCGLVIDLCDIPVKQETVEICELFRINPYQLASGGSLLITARNGSDIVRSLGASGINAAVIGKVAAGNDRVVVNGDGKRFLEPQRTDELYKICDERKDPV